MSLELCEKLINLEWHFVSGFEKNAEFYELGLLER